MQQILTALKQIESLTEQEHDLMGELSHSYCVEHDIIKSRRLEEAFLSFNEGENKVLNIGIVGRVKAGKSSLLNALFFQGDDILPQAATPMTSSLTVLGYGNNEATVELFNKDDLADIKAEHDTFINIRDKKLRASLAKVQATRGALTSQLEEQVRQSVDISMQTQPALPYYELYEQIAQSPLLAQIEQSDKGVVHTINAESPQAIAAELQCYVGSEGSNSIITKSAQLKLNIPELKELRVVDTPGLNDPVASRSQRTLDFLHQCDVIFVVSPSSQFLTDADLRLIIHALQKQSISKIYIIASKADTSMVSDVADKNSHLFEASLESLHHDIETMLSDCVAHKDFLKQSLQGAPIFICSSTCFSLARKIQAGIALSENEALVLRNLSSIYPTAFSIPESTVQSLGQLAGIDAVRQAISEVRSHKDAIIAERQAAFVHTWRKEIDGYLTYLQQQLVASKEQFDQTELAQLQSASADLQAHKDELSFELRFAFDQCFDSFKTNLSNQIEGIKRKFAAASNSANKLEREDYLFGLISNEVIDATQVRNAVQNHFGQMIAALRTTLDQMIYRWIEQAVQAELKITNAFDHDWCLSHGLTAHSVERAVKVSLYEVKNNLPKLDLKELDFTCKFDDSAEEQQERSIFSFLFSSSVSSNSGVLSGEQARKFEHKVRDLLNWFEITFRQKCDQYFAELSQVAEQIDVAASILGKVDQQLTTINQQLQHRERTFEQYDRCLSRLSQIAADFQASEA